MTAKIIGFGARHKKARKSFDKEGIRASIDRMLDLSALIEAGRITSLVVIAEDVDGEPQGFSIYDPNCAASVLRNLNYWRENMRRVYHGERD